MEIERSRNGYYTLTFLNKNNLGEKEILKVFSSVGNVCKIIKNFQRIFIRYRDKDEAERAIQKYGKEYDLQMAINKESSDNQSEGVNQNNKPYQNQSTPEVTTPEILSTVDSMDTMDSNKVFHLILGNLPKNYTIKDVKALVEEAKPVSISQLEETRVFNIRFTHIILRSAENLTYLIDKLNGFVISGEKLIAAQVKDLLEWSIKAV